MKFLHILTPYSLKPQNIIRFINKNFNKTEHTFLILADEEYVLRNNPQLFAFENVIFTPKINQKKFSRFKRMKFMEELFLKFDNIIWHSFLHLKGLQMLYGTYKYRNKITWIEYGKDLYDWKWKPKNIKNKVAYYLVQHIRKDCKYLGVTVENDKEIYFKTLNQEKTIFYLPIPFNADAVDYLIKEYGKVGYIPNKEIRILIGSDGLKYNQHLKIIDRLQVFREEKFSCFLPMNYALPYEYGLSGTKKYATEVIEYGNRVLNVPVIKLQQSSVQFERYFKILNAIDIAIFDFDRPIYLEIVYFLLYLNKKIFLPADSALYKSLVDRGVKVFDTNKIVELNYSEFIDRNGINNKNIMKSFIAEDFIKRNWKKCFDFLSKESK